jgi:hypothetical protein
MSQIKSMVKYGSAALVFLSCFNAQAESQAQAARPEVFQKLLDCKTISDPVARLACFDQQVANFESAERDSSVVVIDKKQIRQAKKGLFGLSLPSVNGLLGRGDKDDDDLTSIETTIKSARQLPGGKWLIILEDGARWVQTEAVNIFEPKVGQPVRIRKGALGGFLVNINGRTAIRMSRQNQ